MCTVTLYPFCETNFVLSSSRDESTTRKTLPPKLYIENGVKLLYPKDVLAGGTWIGVSEKKHVVCLLNGGFTTYKKDACAKSRGLVVTELLAAAELDKAIYKYNCSGIAPFTIIGAFFKPQLLFIEFVWDGARKHIKMLDLKPRIWSSSTLYEQSVKALRQNWFAEFINKNKVNPDTLQDFHEDAGVGNQLIDLKMNRGTIKTTSITQLRFTGEEQSLYYKDLITKQTSIVHVDLFDRIAVF